MMDPWKDAVIDELVIAHIYRAEHDSDPRKAVRDAIQWNVYVALDPRVSSEAQALIDRGREEAQADAEPIGHTTRAQIEAMHNGFSDSFAVREAKWLSTDVPVYLHPPRRESAKAELSDEEVVRVFSDALKDAKGGLPLSQLCVIACRAVLSAAGGEG